MGATLRRAGRVVGIAAAVGAGLVAVTSTVMARIALTPGTISLDEPPVIPPDLPEGRLLQVPTPAGAAPAVLFGDPASDTWCVQVHGRGMEYDETFRAVRPYVEAGMAVLCVSYRVDPNMPGSSYGLGDTEWLDVEAAVLWAIRQGARHIVLQGWSMGGAIVLRLERSSRLRRKVVGIVLDSPVIAWEDVLEYHGQLNHLPGVVAKLATVLVRSPLMWVLGVAPVDLRRLNSLRHAGRLSTPTLLLQGDEDTFVPVEAAREFAALRPDLVDYIEWPGGVHTQLWNQDPERYRAQISGWLQERGLTA